MFSQKSNIQQLKEEIREKLPGVPNSGTLRHSHKKSRPAPPPPMSTNGSGGNSDLEIRAPSELLVGVPATLTTQWRHRPRVLVSGSVNYIASVSTDRPFDWLTCRRSEPPRSQIPAPQSLLLLVKKIVVYHHDSEDGRSSFLRNVGELVPDYTASHTLHIYLIFRLK